MKKYVAFAVAMLAASSLYAKPIYLNCEFDNKDELVGFTVQLDESTREVTHSHTLKTGEKEAYNSKGFWAPNSISYKYIKPMAARLKLEFTIEIDRTTLKFERQVGMDGVSTGTNLGSCEIMEVKNRKI